MNQSDGPVVLIPAKGFANERNNNNIKKTKIAFSCKTSNQHLKQQQQADADSAQRTKKPKITQHLFLHPFTSTQVM